MEQRAQRLGIYLDAPFRLVELEGRLRVAAHPADYALVGVFLAEVGSHFRSLTIFGRADRADELGEFVPLAPKVEFVELPHYDRLSELHRVAGASAGTARAFWRGLAEVDAVWIFGPHPFGLLLAGLAFVRRKRCALGVRQDTMAYFRRRIPNAWWAPALLPAYAVDALFRLLSRRRRTLVVGQEIGRRYGHRPQVLVMSDPVVRAEDVAPGPPRRDWSGETRLLTVGRMDPEKNPLLLVRALAELEREEPGRYVLSWIGSGPLEDEVRGLASALGVADRLELLGWMPFDQALLDRYRQAHLFVHVSLTEGVPRVLYEALACGTPIVATDVGGVARALDDGEAALLVPPDNLDALLAAIRRLAGDAELRDRLVVHGLELVRDRTLEGEAARAAAFIAGPEAAPAVEVGAAI